VFRALLHGPSGHPAHPPLTDATIGMFALATVLGIAGAAGAFGDVAGKAMWLALAGGLCAAAPTALTGFFDWVEIEWGTPVWRTATIHLSAMVTAVALFAVATWLQWDGWHGDGHVGAAALAVTLVGFGALTLGGWFGGAVVYVHGMRVLEHEQASATEAAHPAGPETAR
jgi:uncharacterized membrane protein